MVQEYRDKNKPNAETLYGWYPGGNDSAIRESAKDCYINLGVRPPRENSYTEADLIYQYHRSLKPSERANAFSIKQTPDDAVKPPWSLHLQKISNQANQEELDKQFENRYEGVIKNLNRTKSAPSHPTHRIILKIPHAQLSNIYDVEGEFNNNNNNNQETDANINDEIQSKENQTSKNVTLHFANNNNQNKNINSNIQAINVDTSIVVQNPANLSISANGSSITDISGNLILGIKGNASTIEAPYQNNRPKSGSAAQRASSASSQIHRVRSATSQEKTYKEDSQINVNNNNEYNDVIRPNSGMESRTKSNVTLHFSNHPTLNDLHTQHKEALVNNNNISNKQNEIEKRTNYLRSHKSQNSENKSPAKETYRCKVIEVENFGKDAVCFDQVVNQSVFIKGKHPRKNSRAKTAAMQQNQNRPVTGANNRPQTVIFRNKSNNNNQQELEQHYTIADYHRELQLASPDKKPITQTTSQIELANKFANRLNDYHNMSVNDLTIDNSYINRDDVKIAEGHWKDQLLGREKFLQKRPRYHVKIDPDKVRSDPPAPVINYKCAETHFYNTSPSRKATFTINPHFRSEILNVQKLGLKDRTNTNSPNYGLPVKYRRNYAFCY